MFVDSSALVSIVVDEPGSTELAVRLSRGNRPRIASVTQVEAAISVGRFHDRDYAFGALQVADFIERAEIEVLAVPADIVPEVLQAYQRFGRGTGHKAQLNFGDCFSYAFSKRLKVPLLFKGNDFSQTDVDTAS